MYEIRDMLALLLESLGFVNLAKTNCKLVPAGIAGRLLLA